MLIHAHVYAMFQGHVGLSVAAEDNDLKKMVAEKIMPQLGLLLFELY